MLLFVHSSSFSSTFSQIQCLSTCYLKTLESLNGLHSLMDQFVHYIYEEVYRYQAFHIFAQYI